MSSKVPDPTKGPDAQAKTGAEPKTTPETGAEASEASPVAPFRRGAIVWGRPPQAVFHVGPLPRDEGMARLMAMPPYPNAAGQTNTGAQSQSGQGAGGAAPRSGGVSGGLGGFSNVPQAPRKPAQPSLTNPQAAPTTPGSLFGNSLVPPPRRPQPAEATKPAAEAPKPAVEPVVPVEDVQAELEPTVEVVPTHAPIAAAQTQPSDKILEEAPAVVHAVAEPETTPAKPRRANLFWLLIGGVIVLSCITVFVLNKDKAEAPVVPVEGGVTSNDPAVVPDLPLTSDAPVANTPPPVTTAPPAAKAPEKAAPAQTTPALESPVAPRPTTSTPAPTKAAPAAQTPSTQAPATQAPATQGPVVVDAPAPTRTEPQGPPPTPATSVPTDPNAPIVTSRRPLD